MNLPDYKSDTYHRLRHPEFFESEDLFLAWSYFVRHIYFKNVNLVDRRILEYGGALGYNLLQLKEYADVALLEPSGLGRTIAEKHGIPSYASAIELSNTVFDIVLCRHVLEHIVHPAIALEEIHSLLVKDGQLILILPIDKINGIIIDNSDINHHLYMWNAQAISNLLGVAGFSVNCIRYEYYGMRKKLLPLFRLLGGSCYARAVRAAGRLFNFRELLIVANKL